MAGRAKPLSPHLQIYRLPLNAILSITHRITGVVLALGAVLVVAYLIAAASGSQAFGAMYSMGAHWLGQIVLFGFTLALYYHMCAGVRHLFWDAGYGYELQTARRTSYAIIVVAVVLTLVTWTVAYTVSGG
ncbi:succinate dehydrogenase, cytochrome b556 subunit [Halofilum ochraceum]|uniref:succinate dehydrogenase, cytochrome b556 subunit n=1 Tax=Halofilum ochraceum TaxID=1611323 RepID=UPI0008330327|nr:succinate dehydrogenase, cytochrome b556 subunit [Halofilum ochraceum]